MFCTKCGADCTDIVGRGGKFCRHCGAPLPVEGSAAKAAPYKAPDAPAQGAATAAAAPEPEVSAEPAFQIPHVSLSDAPDMPGGADTSETFPYTAPETTQVPPFAPPPSPDAPLYTVPQAPEASSYTMPQAAETVRQPGKMDVPPYRTSAPQGQGFAPDYSPYGEPGAASVAKRSKKPLIIGLIVLVVAAAAVACLFIFGVFGGGGSSVVGQWSIQGSTMELSSDGNVYQIMGASRTKVGTYTTSGDTMTWSVSADAALFAQLGLEGIDLGDMRIGIKYVVVGDEMTLTLSKISISGMEMDVNALISSGLLSASDTTFTLQRVKSNA